ncbi:extracellular solute-binding protein [Mesorhizobium sp. M0644]|uniref:extracellular solute-binding protein n=1 Tax=unclassified Mesorhizobium TaxID=325217 RepID=UPI00333C30E3
MIEISRRSLVKSLLAAPVVLSSTSLFAQTRTNLTANYATSAFDALMAQAADLYAKHAAVSVTFQKPAPASGGELIKQTLLNAITGGLPDISFSANNYVQRLASQNLAQPLDKLAAADSAWSQMQAHSTVGRIGQVDGRLYGVPFQVSVPVCMVNLALAEKAGADPRALPTDWPGVIALAKRISTLGNGIVGGFFDLGAAWTFQALITADGGQMATPDGRDVGFEGPIGMKAMEVLKGFGEAGMISMSDNQAFQGFGAGTIGIYATSNNVLSKLEKQAAGNFEIATIAWPLTSPNGLLPAGGRTGVVFTKDPDRQAAAWQFLQFMTSPEIQTLVVKATGAIPLDPDAVQDDKYLGGFYKDHKNHSGGLARAKRLTGWYSYPGENAVKINELMIDRLGQVATLKASPDAMLKSMSQEIRGLLPKA